MEFWAVSTQFVSSGLLETASAGELQAVFLSEGDARDVFSAIIDAERKAGSLTGAIPRSLGLERNTIAGAHVKVLDAAFCMRLDDDGATILFVELVKITQPSKEECIAKLSNE